MSDLAESSALSLTSPQLPVSWYFDPAIYALELKHLFGHGSGYAGHLVTCDDLKWEYGDWWSVQTVGVNRGLAKAGSPVYQHWHQQVLAYQQGKAPAQGSIWLTYYPGLMVEWYPHVLVSSIIPTGVESCRNVVEFYYPEDIVLFERAFIEAEQAAYQETAEDDDICARMHKGRRALYQQGISETGPYQSPLEDGMMHFHAFLRRELSPHLEQAQRREIEPHLK